MWKIPVVMLTAVCLTAGMQAAAQTPVRTPVFSPALFSGPVNRTGGRPASRVARTNPTKDAAIVTFLYFADGQINMTAEQKQQLVPVIKRISSGETRQVIMSGVSVSEEDSKKRLNRLSIFLRDYNRDVSIQARVVDRNNVINNNNVVQIVEKR